MKPEPPKPDPPKPAWTPNSQPIASPLQIEDVSPFVEPLAPPILGVSSGESATLCDSCENCWKMRLEGQFKNTRDDGSGWTLTERFCVFNKDSLITLAERTVKECSRFIPKKSES